MKKILIATNFRNQKIQSLQTIQFALLMCAFLDSIFDLQQLKAGRAHSIDETFSVDHIDKRA